MTPFSWSAPSAVNQHVADLGPRAQGAAGICPWWSSRPTIPTTSAACERCSSAARGQVVTLLEDYRTGSLRRSPAPPARGRRPARASRTGIPVIPLGSSFPVRLNGSVANLGLPVDVTSRLEKLMLGADFDLVHVHEPLAPSLSFTALREARSPVVATFHLTPVAVAAYELGQSVLERFFLRLDARVVTFPDGRRDDGRSLPGRLRGLSVRHGHRVAAGRAACAAPARRLAASRAFRPLRLPGRRPALVPSAAPRPRWPTSPPTSTGVVVAFHRPSADRWLPRGVPRKLRSRVTSASSSRPRSWCRSIRRRRSTILPFLGGEWLCSYGRRGGGLRLPGGRSRPAAGARLL